MLQTALRSLVSTISIIAYFLFLVHARRHAIGTGVT
jgi:hypothetical protein